MPQTFPNDSTGPSAPPPEGYSDAPPEEERRSTSFLILAVNFAILAVAAWWVIHRFQQGSGTGQPNVSADPKPSAADGTPGDAPATVLAPVAPEDLGSRWDVGEGPDRLPGTGAAPEEGPAVAPPREQARGGRVLPPPTARLDGAALAQKVMLEKAIDVMGPGMEVIRAVQRAYTSSAKAEYGANRGIEALYEELERRGGLEGVSLALGDTDGDGRKELLDPWGRALVYFSNDDYGTSQEITGVGTLSARDRWLAATSEKAWQGEKRFQLFSVGPNGKDDLGGFDDVNSWVTKD
jgi:hypothetical protein